MSKESFPELLLGASDAIPPKKFHVGNTVDELQEGETLTDDNVEDQFEGDDSLGSAWVGWGVIRSLVNEGKQAVLIFNQKDKPKMPGE